jgi:hypothetical protein
MPLIFETYVQPAAVRHGRASPAPHVACSCPFFSPLHGSTENGILIGRRAGSRKKSAEQILAFRVPFPRKHRISVTFFDA